MSTSQGFTVSNGNGELSEREEVSKITEQDNMGLISNVTKEEVKTAVYSMHPEKSPGLDDFNPNFINSFGLW